MKKMHFLVLALFLAGIFSVAGQTAAPQLLTPGQIVTGNLKEGEVHLYRIQLGNDSEYFVAWDDADTSSDMADIRVGIRGEEWGRYLIEVKDDGNFGMNLHRLVVTRSAQNSKTNPLNNRASSRSGDQSSGFAANTEYVIEVRGYDSDQSGSYRIVFY
jgi:hypothetical protein